MKKVKADFSSKVMLLWALMNIVMMPLAFASPDIGADSKSFGTESISTTTFSKITPLVLEKEGKAAFFSNGISPARIFFILMCLMMIACLGLSCKFKLSRKGQLTIFILVVLVLAVVFGFVFYLTNLSKGKSIEQEREKIFTNFMEASGFKNYMQTCLDKTSADAIELIGMQGGYLYSDYPNEDVPVDYYNYVRNKPQITIPTTDKVDHFDGLTAINDTNWSWQYTYFGERSIPFEQRIEPSIPSLRTTLKYSIKNSAILPNVAPIQPYRSYTMALKSPLSSSDFSYPVGDPSSYLPWPCNDYSVYEGEGLIEYFRSRGVFYHCKPPTLTRLQDKIGIDYPIDLKMADFINEHTLECFDQFMTRNESGFNLYENMLKLNVTLDVNPRKTYVIIGEEDVTVLFNIPIEVTVRGTRYKKTIEFSSRQDVKLRYAYDLAEAIIGKESTDIYFALDYSNLDARLGNICGVFEQNASAPNEMVRVQNQKCLKDGMYVDVSRDNGGNLGRMWCNETPDDWDSNEPAPNLTAETVNHCLSATVVKIIDNKSIVNSQPFVFLFAVENRPPALNYIDRKVVNSGTASIFYDQIYYYYLINFYLNESDTGLPNFYQTNDLNYGTDINDTDYTSNDYRKHIIMTFGRPIKIIPQAVDPDDPPSNTTDNNIIYTYEGWKSDKPINLSNRPLSYDINESDNLTNLSTDLYREPYANGNLSATDTNSSENVWENSDYYQGYYSDYGIDSTYLESIKTEQAPLGFNNIAFHNFIHKDAIYNTTGGDVGYHWVRVYARDKKEPDRLFDYQDIFIQVVCIPGNTPCCTNTLDFHYENGRCDVFCPSDYICTYHGCCNSSGDCIYDKSEDPVRTCP